ncbi:hypothetical protein [uncultured Microscilla sp.]|uniref:hypothetical protein n=1 Tax=uncultured Microscilla sp. TaxID=432653 RepID=UPI002639B2DE|nr:hypothetical protein [uncultured Microscilla sp.]
MPNNTLYTIGSIVFIVGIVLANGWVRLGTLNLYSVWIMTIGFALCFIARTGSLRLVAGLIFAFGLALSQGWLNEFQQVHSMIKYAGWIMAGGFMVLSFSR